MGARAVVAGVIGFGLGAAFFAVGGSVGTWYWITVLAGHAVHWFVVELKQIVTERRAEWLAHQSSLAGTYSIVAPARRRLSLWPPTTSPTSTSSGSPLSTWANGESGSPD